MIVATVVVLMVTLGVASVQGLIPGTSGCRLRSVDEKAYVAANEAVLRTIPLPRYLRDAYSTTWTHAQSAGDSCLPLENGPPYSAFVTTHVYVGPHLGFDNRILRGRWISVGGDGSSSTYRRGRARLTVTATSGDVLISIDHHAYADSGR